jgi:clan AA aspartic protease (TIGR02281 family)
MWGANTAGLTLRMFNWRPEAKKGIVRSIIRRSVMRNYLTASVAITASAFAAYWHVAAADVDPTVHQIYEAASSGHLDQAQHMMDQVLRDHPKSSKAHFVQAELYAREGKSDLARAELNRAEELKPGLPDERPQAVQALKAELGMAHAATNRIPLAREGGTLVAPVIINNAVKLNFTVDSGAADVSIPADVFSTLVRTGTVRQADMRGSRRYMNADGESHESKTFVIRSLKVGNAEVSNVEANVSPTNAPLLLGQSFLNQFKNWSIDNTAQELILER